MSSSIKATTVTMKQRSSGDPGILARAGQEASRSPSAHAPSAHARLSPSLRCSAASLVSWESEMKHCSSGREKLFCSHRREVVSVGVGWQAREVVPRLRSSHPRAVLGSKLHQG